MAKGKSSQKKPTVISLFTGAGGLDYGFEAAGFRTRVAVEMDSDCCKTLRLNRAWAVLEESVFDVRSRDLLRTAKLRRKQPDLLAGGPPCQPFSKAGNWARQNGRAPGLQDERANTVSAFMRIVEDTLPRVVLLENVEGFRQGVKSGLDYVKARFAEINEVHGTRYAPVAAVLDAVDYGVPQSRRRLFVVAARDGKRFDFPSPTHGPDLAPVLTAWDAIGGVSVRDEALQLRGQWADLLPSIPEGDNYLWHTDRGGGLNLFGWRKRYWTFLLKLAKNRPSWTIQAHPGPAAGPFHWKNRKLSILELCRLQTFPRGLKIEGGHGAAHRQVGNAVPSLLAEVLGREIRRQLLGHRVSRSLLLLPKRRRHVPRRERTKPVPAKYMKYIGNHRPHPGTGKGPGAKRRAARQSAPKRVNERPGLRSRRAA